MKTQTILGFFPLEKKMFMEISILHDTDSFFQQENAIFGTPDVAELQLLVIAETSNLCIFTGNAEKRNFVWQLSICFLKSLLIIDMAILKDRSRSYLSATLLKAAIFFLYNSTKSKISHHIVTHTFKAIFF